MEDGSPSNEVPRKADPAALPADVSSLRSLLRQAELRGFALAEELGALVDEWMACAGNLDGEVARLQDRIPAFAVEGTPATRWLGHALRAALARGLMLWKQEFGDEPDPETLQADVDMEVRLLVSVLLAQGVEVAGSEDLRPISPRAPVLPAGERWEARSRWQPETINWHRFILRRDGAVVHLLRERAVGPEELIGTSSADDAGALLAMLRVVGMLGVTDK